MKFIKRGKYLSFSAFLRHPVPPNNTWRNAEDTNRTERVSFTIDAGNTVSIFFFSAMSSSSIYKKQCISSSLLVLLHFDSRCVEKISGQCDQCCCPTGIRHSQYRTTNPCQFRSQQQHPILSPLKNGFCCAGCCWQSRNSFRSSTIQVLCAWLLRSTTQVNTPEAVTTERIHGIHIMWIRFFAPTCLLHFG